MLRPPIPTNTFHWLLCPLPPSLARLQPANPFLRPFHPLLLSVSPSPARLQPANPGHKVPEPLFRRRMLRAEELQLGADGAAAPARHWPAFREDGRVGLVWLAARRGGRVGLVVGRVKQPPAHVQDPLAESIPLLLQLQQAATIVFEVAIRVSAVSANLYSYRVDMKCLEVHVSQRLKHSRSRSGSLAAPSL